MKSLSKHITESLDNNKRSKWDQIWLHKNMTSEEDDEKLGVALDNDSGVNSWDADESGVYIMGDASRTLSGNKNFKLT